MRLTDIQIKTNTEFSVDVFQFLFLLSVIFTLSYLEKSGASEICLVERMMSKNFIYNNDNKGTRAQERRAPKLNRSFVIMGGNYYVLCTRGKEQACFISNFITQL
jgi:hypothetical protein